MVPLEISVATDVELAKPRLLLENMDQVGDRPSAFGRARGAKAVDETR